MNKRSLMTCALPPIAARSSSASSGRPLVIIDAAKVDDDLRSLLSLLGVTVGADSTTMLVDFAYLVLPESKKKKKVELQKILKSDGILGAAPRMCVQFSA